MEDEGQVICQAYNDFGEDLAKADLHIRGKIIIVQKLAIVTVFFFEISIEIRLPFNIY